jgi:hypothetical protein
MIDITVRRASLFIVCVVAFSFAAQMLSAQEEPKAIISAKSYTPLGPDRSFALEPVQPTLLNEQVADYLQDALSKKGYRLGQTGHYGIVIDAELVTPDYRERAPERWQLLHLTFPNRAPARRDYFVSLAIYDKGSGLYVWRGEAARMDETIEVDDVRPLMLGALVEAIGKNVQQSPIP